MPDRLPLARMAGQRQAVRNTRLRICATRRALTNAAQCSDAEARPVLSFAALGLEPWQRAFSARHSRRMATARLCGNGLGAGGCVERAKSRGRIWRGGARCVARSL